MNAARNSIRPRTIVIIGNPENRRVELFKAALAAFKSCHVTVAAYVDLLAGRISLGDAVGPGSWVRIESPGENFEVEKGILALGADEAAGEGAPYLTAETARSLAPNRGLILYPRQWYLGYRALLSEIARQLEACPPHHLLNAPTDIVTMFDKRLCHARCVSAGIPVPASLGPVWSYDELIQRMDERGLCRVFVKLAHSSSASGVVAFYRSGSRQRAVTSAELVRDERGTLLYNSLKVRCYTKPNDIAELVDLLCPHHVHVEQWLQKASVEGGTFDLRVVVIGGVARHFVVRQSRTPMTNLHLGNRRGDPDEFLERIGPRNWGEVRRTCARAAGLFPGSLHAGVDVLFTPGFRRHAVLEVNAFGDLLPGVLCEGQDTYAAEIAAMLGVPGPGNWN